MKKELQKLINELESQVLNSEKTKPTVSSQNVGWHIQHSLLVINQIIIALEQSKPKEYKWKFNFWRLVVMGRNKIPRGKGKAPSRVIPRETITKELLESTINDTKNRINHLDGLERNHFFTHPFFGDLNLKPTVQFINLHTQHHIDIIRDVLS